MLLNNSLCQNIKNFYPDSRLVFVADKPFEEAAKYQKGVDEVVVYDKNGKNKGSIIAPLLFALKFPYKNIFAIFITYRNGRSLTIARILRPKHLFAVKKEKYPVDIKIQEKHNKMLTLLVDKEIKNYPICYNIPDCIKNTTKNKFSLPDKYVVLCCISKKVSKDMPLNTTVDLIRKINSETGYTVVFIGAGSNTKQYAEEIEKCENNFINLTNKTTISELADIISNSIGLISVDTGVMHLGASLQVPVAAVFYEQQSITCWAPSKELYNCTIISNSQTAENILSAFQKLIQKETVQAE